MIGRIISHYRIIDKLGVGGMGEVYRAEDTNLGRQVAVKVLPNDFKGDPERLARFDREAKLLASLNHPNIAAIYSLEQDEEKQFLVLELVEGPTLAERLHAGRLPVDECLQICRQIAEGLEAAHEKGIIHRDLKPANVIAPPGGAVKILDFGLACVLHDQPVPADMSTSPTITEAMTRPGMLLGTAAYMSPEQARGKSVDKRADIWAFGCILYECLTGKRAFEGEAITESLASILRGEPDWNLFPAATPWRAKELVQHCLRKDPRQRLHDIADVRIEIMDASSLPSIPEAISNRSFIRVWLVAAVVLGMVVGAAALYMLTRRLRPALVPPVVRSAVRIESGMWLEGRRWLMTERPTRTAMAIADHGGFIVYSGIAAAGGPQAKPQIYLRRMDRMEAAPVEGTEGGISPFLSPDERWIGFLEGGKLKKVSIAGGMPVTLCDSNNLFGAHWNPDDTIVFSSHESLGLSRISSAGGTPEILTVPDKAHQESSHRLPHGLPDGRGVLFSVMSHAHDLQPRLAHLDLRTRKWRVVLEDAADGRYLRSGHLVFLRQGTLMAAAFDLDRLEVRGQPVPAIANVMQALNITDSRFNTAAGQYHVSNGGWLVYVSGGIVPDRENSLVHVDGKGNARAVTDYREAFFAPRLSPDGQRIAYQTLGRERRVWVYDLSRGTRSQLPGDGRAMFVAWAPDGMRLVFGWYKSGQANLWWQAADGSTPMERLTQSENGQFPGSFAPDGSTLAFVETHPETKGDILLLDMKSRRVTSFVNTTADEGWPEISHDGFWMAYASDESGRREVWVRPFPAQSGRWQISKEGGSEPIWSRDGMQLFYRQGGQVWVADIRTAGGFSAGKPRLLFEQRGLGAGNPIRNWDLWPDGLGFLMMKLDEGKLQAVTEMILVQNWFEELERLCPTSR